jgi:hypothetical protein
VLNSKDFGIERMRKRQRRLSGEFYEDERK